MVAIRQSPISCAGHTRPVVDLKFSSETDCGPLLLTASKDGKAILRRGDTGDWIGTFTLHGGAVWCCTMDLLGHRAATGAADFTAKLWDINTGSELLSIPQEHIVRAVDLSSSDGGRRLMTANNKQQLLVYDLESPSVPIISIPGHKKTIRRCLWTDEDRHALTISDDKTINLWDMNMNIADPLNRLVWSASLDECPMDAQLLTQPGSNGVKAVVAQGKFVLLYDFDFRKHETSTLPKARFELPCPMYTAQLNHSETMIVCGGEDNIIYRLDATTGYIIESCRGHFGPVHCTRFSPDGHLFASGSEDGTVRLWQTTVGESYGLWKSIEPEPSEVSGNSLPKPIPASN